MKIRKNYIKDIFLNAVITSIIAVVFYCVIEAKGKGIVVALFDGTSNNLSLDLKVITSATYIVSFTRLWIQERREKNLWTSMFVEVLVTAIIYIVSFTIFRYSNLLFKFLVLFVTVCIAQCVEKVILRCFNTSKRVDEILKYANIFIVILLLLYIFI